jgi:hypothetical protein
MPRHHFTTEERQREGKTRASQASFKEACSKGIWSTLDRHLFFARKWLKKKITARNRAKKPS